MRTALFLSLRSMRISAPVFSRVTRPKQGLAVVRKQHNVRGRSTRAVNVVAFKTDLNNGTGVKLPIECQQLLGLKAGESVRDSILNQAYDDLITSSVEQGYSKATIEGRLELLEIARHDAISNKNCAPDLRSREVTIPYDLIPAALAVLCEVGQSDMVIYLGKELLVSAELEGNTQVRNDVVISMALAYCNMAGDLIEGQGLINAGCRYLEDAQQLLNSTPLAHNLAPTLSLNIRDGLGSLQAQAALEDLSSPLSADTKDTRRTAVRSVKDVLRNAATSATDSSLNPDLLYQIISQLTSEEAVHLQEWQTVVQSQTKNKWVYPGLLESIAVAHIVSGFQQRQPSYIKMAVELLQKLPKSPDVDITHGVCQVLLGATNKSADLLRSAEEHLASPSGRLQGGPSGRGPAEMETWRVSPHSFVLDNSPSGDDGLLPGLCLFTELWLSKVAFPMFRDTADSTQTASLSKYFDDARVEALITVYDEKAYSRSESVSALLAGFKLMEPKKTKLIAAGAAGLLGLAVIAGFLGRDRSHSVPMSLPVATATYADNLSSKAAEQLILSWQAAKQSAMGPNFDTRSLEGVLAEPMLGETLKKAAEFKSEGWFMRYTLWKCKVSSVDEAGSNTVFAMAQLDESAALYSTDGRHEDGYRSSYGARYKIVKAKDGPWRIAQVTVLGQEPVN